MTASHAADSYLATLIRGGKAANTIKRYRRYLDELADMYPHADVEDLTPVMWTKWVDRICSGHMGRQLDVDTLSQRVAIAKRFTSWLEDEEIIGKDPLKRLKPPKRKNPVENDKIVWVSDAEVKRMLAAAERDIHLRADPRDKYRNMLCLGVLAYTGSRRAAVSQLRIRDFDGLAEPHPTMRFHEKGGKEIKKPVPKRLADLIRQAGLAGVWTDPDDYLIPSKGQTHRAERDSKMIWKLVRQIAEDAGVKAHVHALRAAFACYFVDVKPDQILALKDLLGHSDIETTMIYVRRRNRQKGMASVVDLDWGDKSSGPGSYEASPEVRRGADGNAVLHPGPDVVDETVGARFELADRRLGDQPLSRRLPSTARAPDRPQILSRSTFESSPHGKPQDREPSFPPLDVAKPTGLPPARKTE